MTLLSRLLLPLFLLLPPAAGAVCTQPAIVHFLKEHARMLDEDAVLPYSESDTLTIYRDINPPGSMRWLGVRWLGPVSGALFVLDCQGNALAAVSIGGVTDFGKEMTLPDGTSAMPVIYIAGTGTGFELSKISLVVYEHAKLRLVWTHNASETLSNEEDRYTRVSQWTPSADGRRIEVTLKATPEEGLPKGFKLSVPAVARESFCWNEAGKSYGECTQATK